jgi:hypothetical protein
MIFDWEFYIRIYTDLVNDGITTEEKAKNHWNLSGKKEERLYVDVPIFFDWKNYMYYNCDIEFITEYDAWRHFLYHSQKENRYVKNIDFLVKYRI